MPYLAASVNLHPCLPIQRASRELSFFNLKVITAQHDVLLCTRFSAISHTNCDAQYSGRKPKTSVQFRVHLTAESHFVILTVVTVQYVGVVVQRDGIGPEGDSKTHICKSQCCCVVRRYTLGASHTHFFLS